MKSSDEKRAASALGADAKRPARYEDKLSINGTFSDAMRIVKKHKDSKKKKKA